MRRPSRPATATMPLCALLELDTARVLEIVLLLALLFLSLAVHETAHAWVALLRGDTTARDLGRITLNPLVHIDPFMTILLPLMLWFTSNGTMIFGGAKPVPVSYFRLRHPLRDMMLVALAGPLSNLLLAFPLFLAYRIVVDVAGLPAGHSLAQVLENAVTMNLFLAVFNLLPLPPLDGSRVMTWLLPKSMREAYNGLESVGLLLVIGLLYLPVVGPATWRYLSASVIFLFQMVKYVVSLGYTW